MYTQQKNDKEQVKFLREYSNIKRMNTELKKYAYSCPLSLKQLTDRQGIELEFILNSLISSCQELKRLYNMKGGD